MGQQLTHSRSRINELLEQSGLAPRRDLGQNFVADANTVRRIASLAKVGAGDHVVEIGAGLGSLTLALADTGAEVTAVEVDLGVVPVLRDVVFFDARLRVRGTFPPSRRASESPIAMACLRLVTRLPERPLFSVPRFRSCIAFSTFSPALRPYFATMVSSRRERT